MVETQCRHCGVSFNELEPGLNLCNECWKKGNLTKTCSVCGIEYAPYFFLKGSPICVPCRERLEELQDAVVEVT